MEAPPSPKEPNRDDSSGPSVEAGAGLDLGFLTGNSSGSLQSERYVGLYQLEKRIKEGGQGEVWLAKRSEAFSQLVAVKLLKERLESKSAIPRFEQEREALAAMNHPNIPRILDGGLTENGLPYFVMEYVKGQPITEFCDERKLGIQDRLELFLKACEAVQHAHDKGIIHRDLKPDNILAFDSPGQKPDLKVLDFGVAKATNLSMGAKAFTTQDGALIGTPAYMSPEQANPSRSGVDTRSDVYSLGVLLYELMVGVTPFDVEQLEKGDDEVRRLLREVDPPTPSSRLTTIASTDPNKAKEIQERRRIGLEVLEKKLKSELEWIPIKAMRKEPQERYPTPTHLADDIRRYLSGDVVEARPPTYGYRLGKSWRRHKSAFGAVALVFVALTIGLVVAFLGWRETGLARDEATKALASLSSLVTKSHEDNILMADDYLQSLELSRLRERLSACPASSTNTWEWRYLHAASDNSIVTLNGHKEQVNSVAFSTDGQRVVTGSIDKTARIWDARLGQSLVELKGHEGAVISAEFGPDGQKVVTGSEDKTARIWDARSGQSLVELTGHEDMVTSVAFSPDGQRVVTGSVDKTARIWDVRSGQSLVALKGHEDEVLSVAFSPDGERVVTQSEKVLIVYAAQTGDMLHFIKSGFGPFYRFFITPDSKYLFGVGRLQWQKQLGQIWDLSTGRYLGECCEFTRGDHPIAFSKDLRKVVVLSDERKSFKIRGIHDSFDIKMIGHTGVLTDVDFSPDGQRVITGSEDGTAKIWDAHSRGSNRLNGYWFSEKIGHLSQGAERLVTGINELEAVVWDLSTGLPVANMTHQEKITSTGLSIDARQLVTGSDDKIVRIWNVNRGRLQAELKGHDGSVTSVAFSPDGERVVTGSEDKTVRIWDMNSGRLQAELKGHEGPVTSVAFSPDGERVVTGSEDTAVRIWNLKNGRQLQQFKGHSSMVTSVAFSPDGKSVVSGSKDSTAQVWDTLYQSSRLHVLQGSGVPVVSVVFSPDGQLVVTGFEDGTVWLWSRMTGNRLISLGRKTSDSFNSTRLMSISFKANGNQLVAASDNGRIQIWDTIPYREKYQPGPARSLEADSPIKLSYRDSIAAALSKSDWPWIYRLLESAHMESRQNHWTWFLLTVLDQYREASANRLASAAAILDRFEKDPAPEVAERVAKAVLFRAPPAGSELINRACVLADRAVTSDLKHPWFPYFQCVKALAEYRRGHWAAAVQFAEDTLKSAGAVPARDAQAGAVVAMARYRLGQPEAAGKALAKAKDLLPKSLLAEGKIPPELSDNWHDLLIAQVLIGEANGVLDSK